MAAEDGVLFDEWVKRGYAPMIEEVEEALLSEEYNYVLEAAEVPLQLELFTHERE